MSRESDKQELIIMRGVSGSGKTTFANESFPTYDIYEADMYFVNDDGEYKFNPKVLGKAHLWCHDSVRTALENGKSVVVSNTNTRLWEMEDYISMAKDLNIPYRVFRMTTEYENVHGCPQDIIDKMRQRFQDHEGEILI